MDQCYVSCLSYDNPLRRVVMEDRFKKAGVPLHFYEGVSFTDPRIPSSINHGTKLIWSIFYGHLDMIETFYYRTTKPFGIFCEDDVRIRKDMAERLPGIIDDFRGMHLDVLLLGYLVQHVIQRDDPVFPILAERDDATYREYHNDIWGAQMYMLSRAHAKTILDRYTNGYADRTLTDQGMTPFCADYTITKDGRRALLYPMMAVEDGRKFYEHDGQGSFHQQCYRCNFREDLFF
jgi:hypothetical protein